MRKSKSNKLIVEGVPVDVTTFSDTQEVAEPDKQTLFVKLLSPDATLPTVAHPGEDLAYDLYASEDVLLEAHQKAAVHTKVAAHQEGHGLLIRDRSSMAAKGFTVSGGVIDAGYRGELIVLLTNNKYERQFIGKGERIAQMIPLPVLTGEVVEVFELPISSRGEKGFGSSGR